jgi:hypothetical protein
MAQHQAEVAQQQRQLLGQRGIGQAVALLEEGGHLAREPRPAVAAAARSSRHPRPDGAAPRRASSTVTMSPLAITGMATAAFTPAMKSQSAVPV